MTCGYASGFECSSGTFAKSSFAEVRSRFLPHDKVYVMIHCLNLVPGEYNMHVNWVHSKQGMVRTDTHQFTVDQKKDQRVYFWFKLSKKGPLMSTFTNQDYHEKHFGDWTVEGYLNDQSVSSNEFTISY